MRAICRLPTALRMRARAAAAPRPERRSEQLEFYEKFLSRRDQISKPRHALSARRSFQGADPMWSRFIADQRGGVAPIFALALVPMIGLAGAAIDYSRAGAARTAMQATLDATALMIAKDAQILQQ